MGIVRAAARGALAGAIATVAMDVLWYRRYRQGGGDDDFARWEFSTAATDYDDGAPAPAQVGKHIADALGVQLNDSSVGTTNNVVHWATGIGWGKFAGLAATIVPVPPVAVGVATGMTAWGTSYVALGAAGIYEPISSYDRTTLWKDLSAHLVFGTVLGVALTIGNAVRR